MSDRSKIALVRYAETVYGTFGKVCVGDFVCDTLEPLWINNVANISCIPLGEYSVTQHRSPKHGETLWLEFVPGRSEILFHKGNTLDDTQGCILPGFGLGYISGKWAVINSGLALSGLIDAIDFSEPVTLTVARSIPELGQFVSTMER